MSMGNHSPSTPLGGAHKGGTAIRGDASGELSSPHLIANPTGREENWGPSHN